VRAAIGEILPFAVVVMLSPINVIAAILLLFSPRPRWAATAYLVGFAVGVGVVAVAFDAVASGLDWGAGSDASRGAAVARVVLGAGLMVAGTRKVRARRGAAATSAGGPTLPAWMDGITGFGPGKAAATGVAIGALNPKNVAMAVAASFAVGAADLTSGETVAVVVVYVVLASAGVAAPLATTLVLGDRARPVLASWRTWLEANNDVVMAVLYLLFGVVLVGKGIAQY
jgi:hypothetical protein